jgi:hypothetical protein
MRPRARKSMVVAISSYLVLVTAAAALAHFIADSGYVWDGPEGKCLKARAEISDGNNSEGFTKSDGWPKKRFQSPIGSGSDCAVGYERPAGYIATKGILWKWHPNPREWRVCAQTAYAFNGQTASHVEKRKYWTRNCGNGYYTSSAPTYTSYNGDWKGGSMWPGGYHFLSSTGAVTEVGSIPSAATPPYVNSDGTQNMSASPTSVGIVDANGDPAGSVAASGVWGPPTTAPGSASDPESPLRVCNEAGYQIGELAPGEAMLEYNSPVAEAACSGI